MLLSIWPVAVPPTGMSVGHCIKASMLGEMITEYANPDDTRLGLGRKAQSAFETSGLAFNHRGCVYQVEATLSCIIKLTNY